MSVFLFSLNLVIQLTNYIKIDNNTNRTYSSAGAWHFVYFNSTADLKDAAFVADIDTDEFYPIEKGFYSVYMTGEQAKKLYDETNYWMRRIKRKQKFIANGEHPNCGQYYVIHSKGCKLPGRILSSGARYSKVEMPKNTSSIRELTKIDCVRSIEPVKHDIKFHTRFNKNMLINFKDNVWMPHKSTYETSFPDYTYKYTGKDQCVLLADSGIDTSSVWLSDPNPENNVFGFTNKPHRKVKKYISYADYKDDSGHGTFLAGLMVGSTSCSQEARLYNGIAPDAKIIIADISQGEVTKLPSNIAELSRDAMLNNCSVQMNAWTQQSQPILTTIIDDISYRNPEVLTVFPAQAGDDGLLNSPADAKNVLTVGGIYGNMVSKSITDVGAAVYVYPTGLSRAIAGIVDSAGPQLFNVTNTSYIRLTIDAERKHACVMRNQNDPDLDKCRVALYFGDEKFTKRFNVPIVRLPSRWLGPFKTDLELSIVPADIDGGREDERFGLLPESARMSKYPGRTKPEIVAPAGPMAGPMAGARPGECSPSALTRNVGTSVAAAMISGELLLLSQFFEEKYYTKLDAALAKACLVASAGPVGRHEYKSNEYILQSQNEPGFGFGLPRIEKIINHMAAFQKNVKAISQGTFSQCFTATSDSKVEIGIAWLDKPRDPYSPIQISSPLIAYVTQASGTTEDTVFLPQGTGQNNIDNSNNAIKISFDAQKNTKYLLKIVSDTFEGVDDVNFSLVFLGDVSLEGSTCPSESYNANNYDRHYYYHHDQRQSRNRGTCPKYCQNNGDCKGVRCLCYGDKRGDFCQYEIKSAYTGVKSDVNISQYQWAYYSLALPQWSPGSMVVFDLSEFDVENYDFLIKSNDIPSHKDYFCSYASCNWGNIDRDNKLLTIKYEQWDYMKTRDPIFIGVYSRSAQPAKNCSFKPIKIT